MFNQNFHINNMPPNKMLSRLTFVSLLQSKLQCHSILSEQTKMFIHLFLVRGVLCLHPGIGSFLYEHFLFVYHVMLRYVFFIDNVITIIIISLCLSEFSKLQNNDLSNMLLLEIFAMLCFSFSFTQGTPQKRFP